MRTGLDVSIWTLRCLRVVAIPEGPVRIGNHWFSSSWVEDVTVPASVREVGTEAFFRCAGLKRLRFAAGSELTGVGVASFMETGLEEVEFPAGVEIIREYAFCGCGKLKNVRFVRGCLL